MGKLRLILLLLLIAVFSSACGSHTDKNNTFSTLEEAEDAFSETYEIRLIDKTPRASFETEDAVYLIYTGEGKETRVAVYGVKIDKTDKGYIINGSSPSFTETHHIDVEEPIYQEINIYEMNIEETDMKFVFGKAFWKRYKPYYNGEYYGRLDRNSMFFYCMKKSENVDIEYR